ncbi:MULTISPECIES: hypothetical protein [unclassified Nocardioides]|uniref:hypothetical protein n=1 Tax=unclassified Nocardioides TaxID=2615069 RepID=UPI0012FCCC85|nr:MULTISPECIES: hypothetical protein [unclassified Nocardioides]
MNLRPSLRAAGTCVLAAAVALTTTQVVSAPAAHAEGEPITVITSPPLNVGIQPPPLIVQKTDPVGHSTPIIVDNPGGTAPTAKECIPLDTEQEMFCLGESGDMLYPSGTPMAPIVVTNGFTAPGELPGDQLDWIITEAYDTISDVHGVLNDDLVKAFARPEVRAAVASRIEVIINKKLYGEPMTPQEEAAFEAIEGYYKQNQVNSATAALAEYDAWDKNPCGYLPPAPPAGSGLPAVPNPVAGTAMCSAANKVDLFRITRNTPPAETFEKWGSYRHPRAMMRHANDPQVRYMTGKTRGAGIALSATAVLATAGVGVGISLSASIAVANAANALLLGEGAASGSSALFTSATAAVAGPAIIIVIALIILAVAIWQFDADLKPGEQITDRATQAVNNTDPLGVRARIGDYASLTHQDFLDRKDPAGQDPAVVHTQAFADGLEAQVADWMMFDQAGDVLPDPVLGYSPEASGPDDIHFAEGGNTLPSVDVAAPAGATNRDGQPVSTYRVLFSRNWLMVSERRTATGVWSPYRPRLTLEYVDPTGEIAQMSLLRHQEGDQPVKIDFQLIRPDLPVAERVTVAPLWTFSKPGGGTRTVGMLPFDLTLRPVNLVPSVQGILIADNVVRLSANLSTPGQGLPGSYAWTLERLDDDGTVAETIPLPAVASVTKRLTVAGRYRATPSYTVDGPPSFTRSGVIEFTMSPPAPEVLSAKIRDERVLDGSLFLDLRLLQATRTDTFTVDVEWANDARGDVVRKTYTVHCQDSGGDVPTCDTGAMIVPSSAPTNENWSESPTFRIPDDQDFLPQVTVKVTNGYGQVTTKSFPIEGDHRPSYDTMTPRVEMPAGTFSRVDVVEVFPSPLLVESQDLTIFPYVTTIASQLPEGVHPDIEERNGHWYLQIAGTPQADAIGSYTFYFPFEQEPLGKALRPAPALATVEIKAATQPGYRSVLRSTPTAFLDRQYRNVYPPYSVQVAEVLPTDEGDFGTFQGTVKCRLTAGPTVVFDKPCANNAPFPWPAEKVSDTMVASTYLESDTQQVSQDGPYEVDLFTKFVDPQVALVATSATRARFQLSLRDLNIVLPPYAGYTVKCSQDGGAYAACFADGFLSLLRRPGAHTLRVRVTAPDGATTTTTKPWTVATPKATFKVNVVQTAQKRGRQILVTGSRLLPGERYVITIGTRQVGTGVATSTGTVRRYVTVPKGIPLGPKTVKLRGATLQRFGTDTFRVIR